MTRGQKINQLFATRAKRLKLDKQVRELKKIEKAFESELWEEMTAEDTFAARTDRATFSFRPEVIGNIVDTASAHKWMIRSKDCNLLQNRVNNAHLRSLLESGKRPGGIEVVSVLKSSLTAR